MATPLYIRGGVEQDLPEVISFYEDVAKQMTSAYNDLYKTLIEVNEKLTATEQTLEVTNKEKEKLLKQNECLIKEFENEPINLGSTHILHNILCNKAEAYKILKENEYCEVKKKNSDSESTDLNKNKVNISEQEVQLKNHFTQIEDLLNQWKKKFENPVINVTLNVTPVPKVIMQSNVKKNKQFKSWQDELKHYVKEKHQKNKTVTKDESNKMMDAQKQNEKYNNKEFIKQEKTDALTEQSETISNSEYSKDKKIEKLDISEKSETKDINKKKDSNEIFNGTRSLCSNKMNSNDKIGSLKKYDELQFSDNSVNSTEKCVEKLSEENKMLNIILNEKKKVYAQVYESQEQGSSYEVFQNLQKMENVQNIKTIQNSQTGDASFNIDPELLQQMQENDINVMKSSFPHIPFHPFSTASSNTVNNDVAIHSTEYIKEKEIKKHDILNAEQRKHWAESKRKHNCDIVEEDQNINSIPLHDFDKSFNSITSNVNINENINTNVNKKLNDFKIDCENPKNHSKFTFPQSRFSHIDNGNSDLYNNIKSAYKKDTAIYPSYLEHNKINGNNNKNNLNGVNIIQVPNFFSPYETNMHLENYNSVDFSYDHCPRGMQPLNYYRNSSEPAKALGAINKNIDNGSGNRNNLENSNNFNHLNSFYNNANFGHLYSSNGFTNQMQNWQKNIPYEFVNDGDTIFYGSASSLEPNSSHLQKSNETIKNNLACSYNYYHGRSNFINGNYGIHMMNRIGNDYKVNKTMRSKSSHISRDIFTGADKRKNEIRNDALNNNEKKHIDQPIFVKNKKSAHLKKAKKSKNRHTKKNNQHLMNSVNTNENDVYSKSKSDISNSSSILNSLCKAVNCQNIRNNNLASNYIDMNFDERLLPYYKENDFIINYQSDEKKNVNEYNNYSDFVRSEKTEKKRKRTVTNCSGSSKGGIDVRSDICNKSCTSDGRVSLSSCNGICGLNNSDDTYGSNFASNMESATETEAETITVTTTETPIETEAEMINIRNASNKKQLSLRNSNSKGNEQDVYPYRFEKRRKQRSPNMTSNDFSCISVCGSFSREEELKNLITERENEIEKEKKTKETKYSIKGKTGNRKMMIRTIKLVNSVKPVRETKRKKTIKGTKRIETTVPPKKEEKEKNKNGSGNGNKNENQIKENTLIYCKNKEVINKKYNNKIINEDRNNITQKNVFCYTSNEATFKTSLETIVSTFVKTKDEACEAVKYDNSRNDKYELRAKKKITYVMPSIKRKLRRDSVRQIFDPFLYNNMWKIKK